jgi:hypothetical protein
MDIMGGHPERSEGPHKGREGYAKVSLRDQSAWGRVLAPARLGTTRVFVLSKFPYLLFDDGWVAHAKGNASL